ncbi:MAG: SH3 domain-containing protein [Chloroflexota bacterium]
MNDFTSRRLRRTARLAGLLLMLGALLGGCNLPQPAAPVTSAADPGGPPPTPTRDPLQPTRPGPSPQPLDGATLSIDQRMLTSHTRWHTLVVEAGVVDLQSAAGAPGQTQAVQLWIEQPARFRVLVRPAQGGAVRMTVSDGHSLRSENGETTALPEYILQPFTPPAGPSDTITPHPLAGSLGTVLADLVFPVSLAQRDGEYRLAGSDTIAGRRATIVEWSYQVGVPANRLWVDDQSGVILKYQSFGKAGAQTPQMEITVQRIEFDAPLAPETFQLDQPAPPNAPALPGFEGRPLAGVLKNDTGYVNLRSGPGTGYAPQARLSFGASLPVTGVSQNGEWWQVDYQGQLLWVYAPLVEVSGSTAGVPVVAAP